MMLSRLCMVRCRTQMRRPHPPLLLRTPKSAQLAGARHAHRRCPARHAHHLAPNHHLAPSRRPAHHCHHLLVSLAAACHRLAAGARPCAVQACQSEVEAACWVYIRQLCSNSLAAYVGCAGRCASLPLKAGRKVMKLVGLDGCVRTNYLGSRVCR